GGDVRVSGTIEADAGTAVDRIPGARLSGGAGERPRREFAQRDASSKSAARRHGAKEVDRARTCIGGQGCGAAGEGSHTAPGRRTLSGRDGARPVSVGTTCEASPEAQRQSAHANRDLSSFRR